MMDSHALSILDLPDSDLFEYDHSTRQWKSHERIHAVVESYMREAQSSHYGAVLRHL